MNLPREASNRRAKSEIRDVIDAIPAMVWIATPDGKGTLNRAWTEYLGLSLEEILGFDWPRTVHPDDVDRYLAAWRLSLAGGQPLEQEVRYRRADGEYRWFLSRALPVRNKRGEIVQWYGIAADIEDRKRAQEAEHKRESELRELIEAIPAMAWSASPDSSCVYVNKSWTVSASLPSLYWLRKIRSLRNKGIRCYCCTRGGPTVIAESESLLEQIGCFRKSVGFRNLFLEIAGLIAIGGLVQNLIKNE
jgi:PAS domain S-box-containing protein